MSIAASRSMPAISPALARTELPKPRDELRVLLSIMGWTTAPTDEPEATIAIASTRRLWNQCDITATDGTYSNPAPRPAQIPWLSNT